MIVVQTFNRVGWPPDSTIELEAGAAAALFTAVRDYEAEKHTSLHGDYLAAPVGGDRTMAEVIEMRAAWRAPRTSALWLTIGRGKYNMDPNSTAIPSLTSPHLDGLCMDFSDTRFLAWLKSPDQHRPGRNIAARYGLVFTLLRENDLRHAQFFPGTATAALDVTSLDNSSTPPIKKKPPEDIMVNYLTRTTGPAFGGKPAPQPQYMKIAPYLAGGCEVTSDPKIANGWSGLSGDGGRTSDDEHWQATIDQAKADADAYHAFWVGVLSGITPGTPNAPTDESGVIAAINALGVLIGGKLDGLPAQIDQYADGKKQS